MPDSGRKQLHLISSDVPFPADYGGMIDVFYTIKQLADNGVDVFLHCFQYGRGQAAEMEQYCRKVWYYPRKTGLKGLSLSLPYMLYSRRDEDLLPNLLSIDAPVLFEGIHCCYLLNHPALKNRQKIVRNQNVEQQYYLLLARRASGILKKIYYLTEAALLRRFERRLDKAAYLVPISEKDTEFFRMLYPDKKVTYIAGFHPFDTVISKEGKGAYCLYHGNLGHPENIEVALFLIRDVFFALDVPLIIAGRNPDKRIIAACDGNKGVSLIANPDDATMSDLIEQAQVQVLPTFQASGLKLKLLYALYSGRFVLVNREMLYGTGLEELCILAVLPSDFSKRIMELMGRDFSAADIVHRKQVLQQQYSNQEKAARLSALIDCQG